MEISAFQKVIRDTFHRHDARRGMHGNFLWLIEEVGELAEAIRHGDRADLEEEFADVFAWLVSIANLVDVDMEKAIAKYRDGCPRCAKIPCVCEYRN